MAIYQSKHTGQAIDEAVDRTVYTNSNPVAATLGGIKAGDSFETGITITELFDKLLYPYVDAIVGNATATPNGGVYEKGEVKTITQVSISITKKSEPITRVALHNGSTLIGEKTGNVVKNGGTITFSDINIEVPTKGNQLTVKVTYPDANGNDKTVEKMTNAFTFVYPYYMGVCDADTTIDEALVESLTRIIEGKGDKEGTFNCTNQRIVFAYPSDYGYLNSIKDKNDFETKSDYTINELSITGLDESSQNYYVYVSGAGNVSDFKVKFKY